MSAMIEVTREDCVNAHTLNAFLQAAERARVQIDDPELLRETLDHLQKATIKFTIPIISRMADVLDEVVDAPSHDGS